MAASSSARSIDFMAQPIQFLGLQRSLRVVWIEAEIRKQKRLSAWLGAAALRLDGHEYGINLGNRLCVVELQHPALLIGVVLIQEPQADVLVAVGSAASPCLKS